MGLTVGRLMDINELAEFKNLPLVPDNICLPEPPENRERTNKFWLIAIGVCILILLPFLIYTLAYSDSRRFIHGVDNCGNICGFNNTAIPGIPCSGKDYFDKPYLDTQETPCIPGMCGYVYLKHPVKRCVSSCPDQVHGFYCSPSDSFDSYAETFAYVASMILEILNLVQLFWMRFLVSISITIGLSIGMLYLYRFATGVVVWTVLILGLIAAFGLTGWMWNVYSQVADSTPFLTLCLIVTFFAVGMCVLTIVLFKKIKLVIVLFKESTKVMFGMPGLIVIPIVSAWSEIVVCILCLTTTSLMVSSGTLTEVSQGTYEYQANFAMIFAIILNIFVSIWVMNCFLGCQYMVVAGSVSRWFFTRNKDQLGSPIITSVTTTFKYHLGSISLGSFVLTIVAIIKATIRSLTRNNRFRILVACWLGRIETFLKFLSKNAYIEVAIHGQPFFRSGRRAAKLLIANAKSMVAINSIGDFVLAMTQIILIAISSVISYGILVSGLDEKGAQYGTVLMIVLNGITIGIIFNLFETTIDSLFICFCEDKVLNDGISRPFYMTKALMEFVETSKKLYEEKK